MDTIVAQSCNYHILPSHYPHRCAKICKGGAKSGLKIIFKNQKIFSRLVTQSDLYAAIRLVKIRSIVSSGTRIIWNFTGKYFWQCEIFFKNCFLRYVPKDAPYPSQKFYVEGVDVNLDLSDDKSVVVTNVSLKTKGTITCEVGHQSRVVHQH